MPASDYVNDPEPPPVAEGADRLVVPSFVGTVLLAVWSLVMLGYCLWGGE